ncbi:MAG: GGDEF domain-containing protein [Rhodoferax sp.]|nr:GGDEF domain-containing protein [Rhodoferax sp.]
MLTALLVLVGWVMGFATLESVAQGWPTMKVNTAMGFLVSGLALFLFGWSRQSSRAVTGNIAVLATVLVVVPVLTLLQDPMGWGHVIDRMLSPLMALSHPEGFGRMSQASAVGFVLVGLAIGLLQGNSRCIWAAQSLASSVLLLALLSLLTYLSDSRSDVARPFSSMAVHTACAFVVLSIALVAVRCQQGWVREFFRDTPTARIGRRYLASTVLVLPLLAQLTIIGERNLGWYGPHFGIVILTAASIAVLASLNWTAVRLGNEADRKLSNLRRVNATLSGINTLIVRVQDKESLFNEACQIAGEAGSFPWVWIASIDPERRQADLQAWAGSRDSLLQGLGPRLDFGGAAGGNGGMLDQVVRTRSPVIVNDLFSASAAGEPEQRRVRELLDAGIRSLVALPLVVGDAVVGVFVLHAELRDFFNRSEMRLLEELAGDVSFAIRHLEKEASLNYLAYYDPLTSLPNRTLFMERLGRQLRSAAREQGQVALVLGNLQRFRMVNETFGRHVGDELLRQLAQRLVQSSPYPDNLSRINSDSFACFMPGDDLHLLGHQVQSMFDGALEQPFQFGEQPVSAEFTVAVAVFPADGNDGETLMANAETTRRPRRRVLPLMYYEAAMNARVAETLDLEHRLRRAVDHGELELHYQPKVDFSERRIRGVEALMRWRDPERGLVPPGQFIPLMEEIGLIRQAGAWALRQAVTDMERWRAMGLQVPRCAVNVSAMQLRNKDFVKTVVDAISGAGDGDAMLDIELTETLLMQDVSQTRTVLQTLRGVGVNVAVDDFGTGYSSLAYLARLPINALKIDRAFIMEMEQHVQGVTIVAAIISLAHSLNLEVIAEGVETEVQAAILQGLQCNLMQGYLFSRPVPFDALAKMLPSAHAGAGVVPAA